MPFILAGTLDHADQVISSSRKIHQMDIAHPELKSEMIADNGHCPVI